MSGSWAEEMVGKGITEKHKKLKFTTPERKEVLILTTGTREGQDLVGHTKDKDRDTESASG